MRSVLSIRTMRRDDMDFALGLAGAEGWNPGLHDPDCFYRADPEGFFIGEADGVPVGCISAVRYPERFGFVGLYIVIPERRGQGLGMQLWNHAMAALVGRNIGLDGVATQQENYKKSGFRLAYRNVRYQGVGGGESSSSVRPLAETEYEAVAAYDRQCFPSSRDAFLSCWLDQDDAHGYALPGDDGLAGWGLIRRCGLGWKIGPLFADDAHAADSLYHALASHASPEESVFLDIPEPNAEAVALTARHSMTPVFETARMYTGPNPDIDLQRIFGVTTFELG